MSIYTKLNLSFNCKLLETAGPLLLGLIIADIVAWAEPERSKVKVSTEVDTVGSIPSSSSTVYLLEFWDIEWITYF